MWYRGFVDIELIIKPLFIFISLGMSDVLSCQIFKILPSLASKLWQQPIFQSKINQIIKSFRAG